MKDSHRSHLTHKTRLIESVFDMSAILSLTPYAVYPLSVGLLTTSSILFGNIGCSLTGPLPIIKGELGNVKLNGKQKLGIWEAFFDEAAV